MSADASDRSHQGTLSSETFGTGRIGAREPSNDVARAASRKRERDALDDLIRRAEAEHGPVDKTRVARVLARLTDR